MAGTIPEDLLQDIARSSYADMLNDDERNRAYDQAIRICVSTLVNSPEQNSQRFFRCCDIGTGSGLLSMMIVRAFQEFHYENFHVTAFESFGPMAECAHEVITRNGMSEYISVIPTSSDTIYEDTSFDLLVAELLDTELIGEGCLGTYKHAVEYLCSPTCLFVPYRARIYIEPIASELLFKRHAIDYMNLQLENAIQVNLRVPEEVANCCGLSAIDDMQVSSLREGIDFGRFSEPKLAFDITFNSFIRSPYHGDRDDVRLEFPIKKEVTQPVVIVMWWDIMMYPPWCSTTDLIESFPVNLDVLSCAPTWARSEELLNRDRKIRDIYERDVWREHWIQGVYYFCDVAKTRALPSELEIGKTLTVYAYRDGYSLSFELDPGGRSKTNCTCGVHRLLSRSQLAFLNDSNQMKILLNTLLAGSINLTYNGIISFKPSELLLDIPLKWCIELSSRDRRKMLYDPSFNDDVPWEKMMAKWLDGSSLFPVESFVIKFSLVYFENLNRIRTKVNKCERFDLEPLDTMIENSTKMIDRALEPHHLWEYETKQIDRDYTVFSTSTMPELFGPIKEGTHKAPYRIPVKRLHKYRKGWTLVFWAEFKMQETDEILSTGPIQPLSTAGDDEPMIEWNRHCNQFVYFLHDVELTPSEIERNEILIEIKLRDCYIDIERPSTSA